MPGLLVVTGPAGAGKSTVAALLAAGRPLSALVHGDDFYGLVHRGLVAPWLPEARAQNEVVARAAAAAAGQLAARFEVVFDGMLEPDVISTFAVTTGLHRFSLVVLLPPVDTCLTRVATRSGHGFTDLDVTRRQHELFAGAGLPGRHVLADLPADAEAVAALIRTRWAAGDLDSGPA